MKIRVFLSYAHFDNRVGDEESGWVTEFRNCLQNWLDHHCEDRNVGFRCEVWWDERMARNQHFDQRIMDALSEASAFVALLSPAYLRSVWCGKEGSTFLKTILGKFPRGRSGPEGIFLVDCKAVWRELGTSSWGRETVPETFNLVRDLQQRVAGVYDFFTKGDDSTVRRICEPAYHRQHPEAPIFFREMGKLAEQLIIYLEGLPREKPELVRVLATPPKRNQGSCWKEFRTVWELLAREPSLQLVDIFGSGDVNTLSTASSLSTENYADLRARVLAKPPAADLLVQVLAAAVGDWDQRVVQFWTMGYQGTQAGTLCTHLHFSPLEKDERLETIDRAEIPDKQTAQRMVQDTSCCLFTSPEDVVRQIVEAARAAKVRKEERCEAPPPKHLRNVPVLLEACDQDCEMVSLVKSELSRQGVPYTNRDSFKTGNVLPSLDDLVFKSIIYVCEHGPRDKLFERANANAKHLLGLGGRTPPRGALFYSPPQTEGFASGSTFAFDEDFPIKFEPTEGAEAYLDLKHRKLQQGVTQFRAWMAKKLGVTDDAR